MLWTLSEAILQKIQSSVFCVPPQIVIGRFFILYICSVSSTTAGVIHATVSIYEISPKRQYLLTHINCIDRYLLLSVSDKAVF